MCRIHPSFYDRGQLTRLPDGVGAGLSPDRHQLPLRPQDSGRLETTIRTDGQSAYVGSRPIVSREVAHRYVW